MIKRIVFEPDAWDDFSYWLAQDKKTAQRICMLLKETTRTPFTGTGKPEPLKHKFNGYWSRRIDQKNRLVYKITDESVYVISCRHHYAP
jgi:toxin YoeB